MESAPINVWTEMRATSEGISITLYSEWRGNNGDPTKVEDEAWYTHTELEVISEEGELRSDLSLSDSTRDRLNSLRTEANDEIPMLQEAWENGDTETNTLMPEAGDWMIDENAPEWSDDERVQVVEVMSDVTADEYLIQGPRSGEVVDPSLQLRGDKTVAEANSSYGEDEPVVIAQYGGSGDEYAFPAGRLSHPTFE